MPKLTPSTAESVAAAYREYVGGKTMQQLAEQYGVTRQAVGLAFKRAGLPVRRRGQRCRVGASPAI